MSRPTIEQLRKALDRIHKVASGQSDRAYMSIPAQPNHDADLLLSAALDELERLRADRDLALRELDRERTAVPAPRKVEFWSCDPNSERLSHDEMEEAVEMHLDDAGLDLIEWPIKVYGWARSVITDREITELSARLAEEARRHFDEDVHGDPDGDHQVLHEDAEQRLDTVIAETLLQARKDGELSSWSCEVVETREVTEAEARQWFPQWFAENAVEPVTAPGR